MKRVKLLIFVITGAFILWSLSVAQQDVKMEQAKSATGGHILITPTTELKWTEPEALPAGVKLAVLEGDPSAAGSFTMRLKLPANFKIPAHWHPVDEHVTVLSGTFNMGMGDKLDEKAGKELPQGSFVVMPAKTNHFAWTKVETVIQLHGSGPWGINYVNPSDDPRLKKGVSK